MAGHQPVPYRKQKNWKKCHSIGDSLRMSHDNHVNTANEATEWCPQGSRRRGKQMLLLGMIDKDREYS